VLPDAQRQFIYYANKYQLPAQDYFFSNYQIPEANSITSAQLKIEIMQEITQKQDKKRIWFLFSRQQEEGEILCQKLNPLGKQIDIFRQPDALTCLYDLSH
jgi:hypothetical protein